MSPLKQPQGLLGICKHTVKRNLLENLKHHTTYNNCSSYEVTSESNEATKAIEELTEYHDDWLLPEIAAEILTIIFTDESGKVTPQNKTDAFRILYSKYSKNLRFGTTLGESFHPAILKHLQEMNNSSNSSKVESICMKGVWLHDDPSGKTTNLSDFNKILRTANNLKRLSVPYIANNELLETALLHCSNLNFLDVSGASEITDKGVERILQSIKTRKKDSNPATIKSLQYLNLGGPGGKPLSPKSVANLLYTFQNLVSLGGYPFMGQVLDYLQYEIDGWYETRLKYIHDRNTSLETLELITYCCPQLQHAYLDTPEKLVVPALLENIPNLKKLKVSKIHCNEINDVMEKHSTRNYLKLIMLEIVNGRESLDLSLVAKACTNLQRLAIYYSMSVHVSNLNPSHQLQFPFLKDLMIYSTEIRGNYSIPILKSCPRIEKLTMCGCDDLTDDNFFDALEANPLSNLKEICLCLAPRLTTRTIWTMITCLERLEFIGRLDTWNTNWMEVESMRNELKGCNLDVTLWELFDSQSRQEGALRGVEHDRNGVNADENVHGAEYIE